MPHAFQHPIFDEPTAVDAKVKPKRFKMAPTFVIDLSVRNLGVAFPLTHDHDLEMPRTGSQDSSTISAFLFSIKSVKFGAQRGETGQAIMKGFSFQFVPR